MCGNLWHQVARTVLLGVHVCIRTSRPGGPFLNIMSLSLYTLDLRETFNSQTHRTELRNRIIGSKTISS